MKIKTFKLFEEAPFDTTSFDPNPPKNNLWLVGFTKIEQMLLKDLGADEVSPSKVVFKEQGYDITCQVEREEMLFNQSGDEERVFDIEVNHRGTKTYHRVDTFRQLVNAVQNIVLKHKNKSNPKTKAKLVRMKRFEKFYYT